MTAEGIVDDDIRLVTVRHKNGSTSHKAFRLKNTNYNPEFTTVDEYEAVDAGNFQSLPNYGHGTPEEVYVEVLVVLDYSNAAALHFNDEFIRKYLGTYWHSVDRSYVQARNPKIHFVISAALFMKNLAVQSFIQKNLFNKEHVNGVNLLVDFRRWLYGKELNFDLAMLQTGLDMFILKSEGQMETRLLGRSYVGTVCSVSDLEKSNYNCGVTEDRAPFYTGVMTTVHELAHILGAPHDGESGTNGCNATDGFIMAPQLYGFGKNRGKFSWCSLEIMQRHLLNNGSCVMNDPNTQIPGGSQFSLTQICQQWFGSSAERCLRQKEDEICQRLWCQDSNQLLTKGRPPNGTPCSKLKICMHGECVSR